MDNQFFTYYSPVQRSRVATAFDYIDFIRGKLLAAVLADHFVAFLVITETGTVTDIAGVNGSAESAVSTFEHKKSDHGAVLRLDLEMMGFAVADICTRDFKFTVDRRNRTAAYPSGCSGTRAAV
ncbi:MAG: hypothetical protein WBD61_00485 [Desulfobulbales bacterium]